MVCPLSSHPPLLPSWGIQHSARIRHMLKCINKPTFCWVSPLLATSLYFVTAGHNSTYSDHLVLAGLVCLFTPSSALLLGAKAHQEPLNCPWLPLCEGMLSCRDSPCHRKGKGIKILLASVQEKGGALCCQVLLKHGPQGELQEVFIAPTTGSTWGFGHPHTVIRINILWP